MELNDKTTVPLNKICSLLGIDQRQIQRIADVGHIQKPEKKGNYSFIATVRGVIEYYKAAANKVSDSKAASAARRETAEADTAEIDLAEKQGLMALKADLKLLWLDGIAHGIQNIGKLKSLSAKQKEDVFSALRGIKLKESVNE